MKINELFDTTLDFEIVGIGVVTDYFKISVNTVSAIFLYPSLLG